MWSARQKRTHCAHLDIADVVFVFQHFPMLTITWYWHVCGLEKLTSVNCCKTCSFSSQARKCLHLNVMCKAHMPTCSSARWILAFCSQIKTLTQNVHILSRLCHDPTYSFLNFSDFVLLKWKIDLFAKWGTFFCFGSHDTCLCLLSMLSRSVAMEMCDVIIPILILPRLAKSSMNFPNWFFFFAKFLLGWNELDLFWVVES